MLIVHGRLILRRLILWCGLALIALEVCSPAGSGLSAVAAANEQPLSIRRTTLSNGLRVVIAPDRTVPVVTVAIFYSVGYVDDPPGREGMAHLVEHMMFRGSARVGDGEQYALVAEAGGYTFGQTDARESFYTTTVPSNQLELVLMLESDRMRNLRMSEPALENQKLAVDTEVGSNRNRYLFPSAEVAALAGEALLNIASLRLSEAQSFYERYYGPNNAVAVITGDLDELAASRLVAKYFGSVSRLPELPNRAHRLRPLDARYGVASPTGRALHLAYPVPPRGGKEDESLEILRSLAGTGSMGRLRERLIDKAKLASSVGAVLRDWADQRWFVVNAVPAEGRSLDDLEAALRKEVAELAAETTSSDELDRVVNQLLAKRARDLVTSEFRADLLGNAELFGRDARIVQQQAAAIRKITSSDVQRLARVYLQSPRTVIVIGPDVKNAGARH